MCFFNSMSKKATELAARYGKKTDIIEAWKEIIEERRRNGEKVYDLAEEAYNISAFGEPDCVIVTDAEELQVMQWGLIPFQTKTIAEADKYNTENWFKNARADKIFDTWPYRFAIESKRCIIPSTGYFEYHHNPDKTTTPYYIYLNDRELFSMAGIWDKWLNPQTEKEVYSFTMITTDANEFTRQIHNGGKNPFRMPLILPQGDEQKWLNADLPNTDIEKLLVPYGPDGMKAYPVGKDFRTKNPHDKSIIEAV